MALSWRSICTDYYLYIISHITRDKHCGLQVWAGISSLPSYRRCQTVNADNCDCESHYIRNIKIIHWIYLFIPFTLWKLNIPVSQIPPNPILLTDHILSSIRHILSSTNGLGPNWISVHLYIIDNLTSQVPWIREGWVGIFKICLPHVKPNRKVIRQNSVSSWWNLEQ